MPDARFRLLLIGIMAAITALVWAFPTWYPVLNPDTISIAYAGLELEGQASFTLLPDDTQNAYFALRDGDEDTEIPPNPDAALALIRARVLGIDIVAPDDLQTTEIPADAQIVRRGTLITPDPIRGATGDVTIFQTPDLRRSVRFDNNFVVTRAPDVHIIFTRNPDPYDKNGVGIDYSDVGTLLYNVGTQTYAVPDGVDFAQYPILALYSPSLNVVISTATLR